jgi:hypothetical protein
MSGEERATVKYRILPFGSPFAWSRRVLFVFLLLPVRAAPLQVLEALDVLNQ